MAIGQVNLTCTYSGAFSGGLRLISEGRGCFVTGVFSEDLGLNLFWGGPVANEHMADFTCSSVRDYE